ncbi:hypothetical protein D3C73_1227530 [compost metagenome]
MNVRLRILFDIGKEESPHAANRATSLYHRNSQPARTHPGAGSGAVMPYLAGNGAAGFGAAGKARRAITQPWRCGVYGTFDGRKNVCTVAD